MITAQLDAAFNGTTEFYIPPSAKIDPTATANEFYRLIKSPHTLSQAQILIRTNKDIWPDTSVFNSLLKELLQDQHNRNRILHAIAFCNALIQEDFASEFIHSAYIACLKFNNQERLAHNHQRRFSLWSPELVDRATNLLNGKPEGANQSFSSFGLVEEHFWNLLQKA